MGMQDVEMLIQSLNSNVSGARKEMRILEQQASILGVQITEIKTTQQQILAMLQELKEQVASQRPSA